MPTPTLVAGKNLNIGPQTAGVVTPLKFSRGGDISITGTTFDGAHKGDPSTPNFVGYTEWNAAVSGVLDDTAAEVSGIKCTLTRAGGLVFCGDVSIDINMGFASAKVHDLYPNTVFAPTQYTWSATANTFWTSDGTPSELTAELLAALEGTDFPADDGIEVVFTIGSAITLTGNGKIHSSKTSGGHTDFVKNDFSIIGDGVLTPVITGASQLVAVLTPLLAGTVIAIGVNVGGTGSPLTGGNVLVGNSYGKSVKISAPVDGIATFDIALQGTGALGPYVPVIP